MKILWGAHDFLLTANLLALTIQGEMIYSPYQKQMTAKEV